MKFLLLLFIPFSIFAGPIEVKQSELLQRYEAIRPLIYQMQNKLNVSMANPNADIRDKIMEANTIGKLAVIESKIQRRESKKTEVEADINATRNLRNVRTQEVIELRGLIKSITDIPTKRALIRIFKDIYKK